MIRAALAAAAALILALAPVAGHASASDPDVLFSFKDPAITESSALVVLPHGRYATTNDSGDSGRIFTVDGTGRTVGVTYWESDPHDVEALAPAPDGRIWVGDIGDNSEWRDSIQVARVPVGRGTRNVRPTTYDLVYPDKAHNAETLVCDPRTGRLYVATKEWAGGTLYAAPEHLSSEHANRLTAVGKVMPMATDGTIVAGKVLLIRGYYGAEAYAWPSLDPIGAVPLPKQQQGEGIGVTSDDTMVLSSEGLHSEVVSAPLPAAVVTALHTSGQPTSGPTPTPSPSTGPSANASGQSDDDSGGEGPTGAGLVVLILVAAAVLWPRKRRI